MIIFYPISEYDILDIPILKFSSDISSCSLFMNIWQHDTSIAKGISYILHLILAFFEVATSQHD